MIRALKQRDPGEAHRTATPLELFVDLASVIAIAAAATGLHHGIAEAHLQEAILSFLLAFFGIWWAWMNYTWFASAYDDDSTQFKLATFVFLSGALVLAAGVEEFMVAHELTLVVAGYVIMRLAMVWLWLAAAKNNTTHAATCRRYASGIGLAQIYWILIGIVFWQWTGLMIALFCLGILIEIAVPFWAEKANMTPWHRHHMIERYGLLNIIVLGEMLLAISHAIYAAVSGGHLDAELIRLAASAAVITFSLWWLYFSREDHLQSRDPNRVFIWGYGHVFIFAAGAATGAGFAVMVEILTHHAHVPALVGHLSIAIPVTIYLAGLWLVRDQFYLSTANAAILPVAAVISLATPFVPFAVEALAGVVLVAAIVRTKRLAGADGTG